MGKVGENMIRFSYDMTANFNFPSVLFHSVGLSLAGGRRR